jgi:hypothetical protein
MNEVQTLSNPQSNYQLLEENSATSTVESGVFKDMLKCVEKLQDHW